MFQSTAIYVIAIGLIALSLGQFLISFVANRRMLHRQNSIRKSQLTRLRNATQVARLNSQLTTTATTSSDSSRQWRVMEVMKVVDESDDTKSFYLSDPNQQPLPTFFPGQYLMIRPALAGKYQATRCYSLSVAPNTKLWRITVKRQQTDAPLRQDRRTGGLSTWLHENIRDGDCLLVGGPSGHFYLSPECKAPVVLIAAGVGITPLASLLQYSTHFTPQRPISLYYQVKDANHWPLGNEVHAYCSQLDSCRVITYLSRATESTLQELSNHNAGKFRSGKVAAGDIVREVAKPDAHYFLCGPEQWTTSLRQQLSAWGVPAEQVHWESFGGRIISPNTDSASAEKSFSVSFVRSGVQATTQAVDQSLWEMAQANDVVIPSGCLSGVCGSCRVKLLKGSVRYDRIVSASLAENECLTCVGQPTSDVEIDA